MKRRLLVAIMIIIAFGFIFSVNSDKAFAADKLYIGIATPLTGPVGNVGTNYKNAVLMAIEDQNKQGGVTIAGKKYKLEAIVRDDKFDPATGKAVAEELVYDKKVKIIIPCPASSPLKPAKKL